LGVRQHEEELVLGGDASEGGVAPESILGDDMGVEER